jgi:CRP-like cAMP-binding protein
MLGVDHDFISALGQRRRFSQDLVAFTQELNSAATLERWQRADCCDSIVANGGIGWVLSGIIRKCVLRKDGQRRIIDMLMPDDFFGFRMDESRLFSFEVSSDETLTARITRREFNALTAMRPWLYQFFHDRDCQTIARLEDHILVQGRTTSIQKIASYLLLMSRRLPQQQGTTVVLPMSRYDIADHIGIAVETVSRAITELRRRGIIELETPRCVSIRDTRKLVDQISSTRS